MPTNSPYSMLDRFLKSYGESHVRPALDKVLRHNTTAAALGAGAAGLGTYALTGRGRRRDGESEDDYRRRTSRWRRLRNSIAAMVAGGGLGYAGSHVAPEWSKSLNERLVSPFRRTAGKFVTNNISSQDYNLSNNLDRIRSDIEEEGLRPWFRRTFIDDEVSPSLLRNPLETVYQDRNEIPYRSTWGLQPREGALPLYAQNKDGTWRVTDDNFIHDLHSVSRRLPESPNRFILNTDAPELIRGQVRAGIPREELKAMGLEMSGSKNPRPDLRNFTLERGVPTPDNPTGFTYHDEWDVNLNSGEKLDSLSSLGRHVAGKFMKPFTIRGGIGMQKSSSWRGVGSRLFGR